TEFKQNEKVTMPNLFPESDDQLLELLSPAIIEDIIIPDGFADTASGLIQNDNSKNQTFDSSTKIDTKEEPASNEEKESQVSDSFTEDLKKKHNRF
ncbi:9284_t:CDS:2, partial [Racocetra fulgida]